jgi:hypothetical protein
MANIQNPHDPETQKQFAAFVKGEPVSNEFLAELAARTGNLLTELQTRGWNPDQACEEMAALFRRADEIFQQPHYLDEASADSMQASSADSFPPTQANESIGT